MDLEFNKEQQLLKSSVQDFLKKESPMTIVREMLSDEMGCSKKVWKKMAELGWLGILVPEEYEGLEGNMIDFAIIMEEMGAAFMALGGLMAALDRRYRLKLKRERKVVPSQQQNPKPATS